MGLKKDPIAKNKDSKKEIDMKKVVLLLVAVMLLAVPVMGQVTMPYCECVEMNYTPQGPYPPQNLNSRELTGIFSGLSGTMEELHIDVGDFPWSAPGVGWYSKPSEDTIPAKFDVYSTALAMNVTADHIECCGVGVVPIDPLFSEAGVTLEWNEGYRGYVGVVGDRTYAAKYTIGEGYERWIALYEGIYSGEHMTVFVRYTILISDPQFRPPAAVSEVE